jgi:hypothetical protein
VREDDIGALVARLREEVDATLEASLPQENGEGFDRLAARAEADRHWAVGAGEPAAPWPGWRSLLGRWGWAGLLKRIVVVPVKVIVRKLIAWYVGPLAAEQRRFNQSTLRLIDELTARTSAQAEELAELRRRVERSSPPS